MRGRDRNNRGWKRRAAMLCALAAAVVVALPALAGAQTLYSSKHKVIRVSGKAPTATAAKKISKKQRVKKTVTAPVSFSSGTAVTSTAECPGKSHASGGGFLVSPNLNDAATDTGLRSQNLLSSPSGKKTWTAGGSAFTNPVAAGSFTTYARCEGNALGKLATTLTIGGTVAPSTTTTALLDCPPGTHVLSGGYAGTGPANLTNVSTGTRTVILESRRSGAGQWTVTAYTATGAPASPFSAYALCELNDKGRSVSEVSTLVPIGSNVRSAADAACTGKKHIISGGFAITDSVPSGANSVVAAGIDENYPPDGKSWHIGMYEFTAVLPAGAALQTFAYCKKNLSAKDLSK